MAPTTRGISKTGPSLSLSSNSNRSLRTSLSSSSNKGTASDIKDRLSHLENIVESLVARIGLLEHEKSELKSQLTSLSSAASPVQRFHTPRNVNPREFPDLSEATQPETIVIPDETLSDEGKWVTVKNKNNRVVKKLWKSNNVNPVGNSGPSRTQTNGNKNRNNKRNHHRNSNCRDNFKRFDYRNNRNDMGYNNANNNHPHVNDLLVNLTNFLMHQTRQPMPIYRNRNF